MAKKLKWGGFTHEDLVVNHEDDIYTNFLLLRLKENGLGTDKARNFKTSQNNVRGTKLFDSAKCVGLGGSFSYGWDRTSWPIPYYRKSPDIKEAFDRRHTLNVLTTGPFIAIDPDVPDAEYERVYPTNGGNFNLFDIDSVLMMASMWGNVFGPIADDTKDYHFVAAGSIILTAEQKREDVDWESANDDPLTSREFIEKMLLNMGCHDRYNYNDRVIKRIVTAIQNAVSDDSNVANVITQLNNKEEFEEWIENSEEWGVHNTEDDNYFYIHVPLQDNDSFCFTYAERILTTTCRNAMKNPNKITKVMLYNEGNSTDSVRIVKSRKKFVKRLNSSWYTRRDYAVSEIPDNLLDLKSEFRKKLSDLPLEVWHFHQLSTESEPVEMVIDEGEDKDS